MPELPEVETIRRQLERRIVGLTVKSVRPLHTKTVQGNSALVVGKKVRKILRFGKMLVIDLEGNIDIGIHLKMSGQLIFSPKRKPGEPAGEFPSKHTRAIVEFTSGDTLYFNDQRIFGWVKILPRKNLRSLAFVAKMGPEPQSADSGRIYEIFRGRSSPVKLVILNQEILSGIGNIYACDGLWEARIKPPRKAGTLTKRETDTLLKSLSKVLEEGIRFGGSTAKDSKYVHLDSGGGTYQEHFRVYDREGQLCRRQDGGIIRKIKLGGRGTYYCPKCQK
ncbi:DNA-formamidopyrimidine glycosylase [Candidatus Gottesmanbacteria bacterium RBG_16_52_11]|uniref:DNA-formamidopyrimidine glycosylase n=1 Tax=Candidatus Gottesmanbacteria bacterium RBG_16_52_11 TaxID=1798374 RepID=A0A1F5YV96_9BACT|nr:MAG: DNA-formamidopyrimidine glycosylase [Candidatus Gottesmanbacteria bacterium RBG_16_52_11]